MGPSIDGRGYVWLFKDMFEGVVNGDVDADGQRGWTRPDDVSGQQSRLEYGLLTFLSTNLQACSQKGDKTTLDRIHQVKRETHSRP